MRAADLDNERFIVMKEGHCLGDQLLSFCERRELRPNLTFRSAQLETVQAMVCAGVGLSLVPAMAVGVGRGRRPEYRSLQSPRPERKIVAVWPRQRPLGRAAEELLNIIAASASVKKPGSRARSTGGTN